MRKYLKKCVVFICTISLALNMSGCGKKMVTEEEAINLAKKQYAEDVSSYNDTYKTLFKSEEGVDDFEIMSAEAEKDEKESKWIVTLSGYRGKASKKKKDSSDEFTEKIEIPFEPED